MPIPLFVTNGTAFVFDVNDAQTLRTTHRICGTLVGTLPQVSQQNAFLGLPLVLIPEEAVLLVEDGICYLVDDRLAHAQPPRIIDIEAWNEKMEREAQQDTERLKSAKESTQKSHRQSADAVRKREARLARRLAAGETLEVIENDSANNDSQELIKQTVTIPAESQTLPWRPTPPTTHSTAHITLASAVRDGLWSYPSTLLERARCAVFRDLHNKGYFLGPGIKFGGDFLAYPGDLLRYHSHFVVSVRTSKDVLRPIDIVAYGRLGTATKKAHLLSGWDEQNGDIEYISIEWAGFG